MERQVEESIWIGDDIEVKVTKIGDKRVHLAVSAPVEITIVRKPA